MRTFFLLSITFLLCSIVSGSTFFEFIYPNFTASYFQFIDKQGAFLFSRNETFKVAVFNPGNTVYFYLCVIHAASSTIIWSANRDAPISSSGKMNLDAQGIRIVDQDGKLKWSTPPLRSSVHALMLTGMGNLVLLDKLNGSLWESFDFPTDTLVVGQKLPKGKMLSSAISDDNLSTGDYRLAVTDSDAILQWQGQLYWKISMEPGAYTNSNSIVEYMEINRTGLFLFGRSRSSIVIQMSFPLSDFRIARLGASGQFTISSFSGSAGKREFAGPSNICQVPLVCGRIGLCADSTSDRPACSCPQGLRSSSQSSSGCMPNDSLYLPDACESKGNDTQLDSSSVSYLGLGYGIDYFAIDFAQPARYGVKLSDCQDFCTTDCSCLGIFYKNSSGSCYRLENDLGSIISSATDEGDLLGYIKVIVRQEKDVNINKNRQFPVIALVLLPSTGLVLLVAAGILWLSRWRSSKAGQQKSGLGSSRYSTDMMDAFYIPGLPQRFDYEELEAATDNFSTQIGSGGFGSVYKGTLPDNSIVAVKKINNLGVQGKKDFCTEIAVIGSIHHVNLVKLRGFCAQGRQRLLVYEYMNRGSLDKTLFGNGPVLEWHERFEIALGTARGLAYLHTGCDQKVIHCDVKPENILLHDNFQAKISDFGLSKLLSPEQSSLFTTMRGTRGYLAPEWLTNSAISEKTDVYSYGMVLLELISGRKNCMTRTQSNSMDTSKSSGGQSTSSSVSPLVYFPLFALDMHEQGRYLELADPRLEGRVTSEGVKILVCVALCCAHEDPSLRPNMASVVGMLEGGIPLCQPRIESLNFLRFYGRRFAEASTIEENKHSSIALLRGAQNSASSTSDSQIYFSFISSQQVSGPR